MRRDIPFVLLLAGLFVAALAVLTEQSTPAPVGDDAADDVFSAARAEERLRDLLGDEMPHPVGSPANARVRNRLIASLEALGLAVAVQRTVGCTPEGRVCGRVSNVLTEIPGEQASGVLLMAHYDSVPAAPGAGDNGAAVAALLEVARILRAEAPYRNSILFAFTDGEEPLLLGAQALFDRHPWTERVEAVINLEGSGSSGPANLLRVGPDSGALVRTFRDVAPFPVANSIVQELFALLPNNTDFNLALEGGYTGIDFAFTGDRHHYHTRLDSVDNLDPGTLQHHGENVLPLVRALANADLAIRADNFVFATVLNRAWLSWPVGASIPLAVTAVGLLVGSIVLLRRELSWRRMLGGVVAAIAMIVAVILAAAAALAAIDAVAGTRVTWPANPWPWRLVIYGSAAIGSLAAGSLISLRLGFWAAHLGGWCVWMLIALLPAVLAPLAANVLLAPLLVSSIVTLVMALPGMRSRELVRSIGAALCIASAGYWMLSIAYATEVTTGFTDAEAIYAPLALLGAVSLPLLKRGIVLRAVAVLAGLSVFAGIIAPFGVPLYSPERPQHLNLRYVADADAGEAFWLVDSPNPVPAKMRALGNFVSRQDPEHEDRRLPAMAAPYVALPPPELTVTDDATRAGQRHLSVQLRSPRLAPVVKVRLPADAAVSAASLAGHALRPSDAHGSATFAFYDPPEAGVRLDLVVAADEAPLIAELWDSSYELPDAGEELLRARGALGTPIHHGDVWTVRRRVEF